MAGQVDLDGYEDLLYRQQCPAWLQVLLFFKLFFEVYLNIAGSRVHKHEYRH